MRHQTLEDALRRVFVGGVSRSTSDDEFGEYFQRFGDVVDRVLMRDHATGQVKGFGFVMFQNADMVDHLLSSGPHVIDGRVVDVKRAIPKDFDAPNATERTRKVFLGGLSESVLEQDIEEYYNSKYASLGRVESVEIKKDRHTGRNRGFAFVIFSSEDIPDRLILEDRWPTIKGKRMEAKKADNKDVKDTSGSRAHPTGGWAPGLPVGSVPPGYSYSMMSAYHSAALYSMGYCFSPYLQALAMGYNPYSIAQVMAAGSTVRQGEATASATAATLTSSVKPPPSKKQQRYQPY